jgi:uncharacterized protein
MKQTTSSMSRRTFVRCGALAAIAAPILKPLPASSAEAESRKRNLLKVAVVTGGHPYDVINFHELFRALPGLDAYIQHMEDYIHTPVPVRDQYDAVVFYHMLMPGPEGGIKAALERVGSTEYGIVVMHHALLAHPEWPLWSDVVGIPNRKFWFHHDQQIKVEVVNPQHPITKGLKSWDMVDETYTMADAGEGSDILLTVDHPKSMKTIGWAREFKKSRVFCLESGHDNHSWANSNFREVLRRGILWSSRKL